MFNYVTSTNYVRPIWNSGNLKFRELEVPRTSELEVPGTSELEVGNFGTWELRNSLSGVPK